jgi:hypothetical protein
VATRNMRSPPGYGEITPDMSGSIQGSCRATGATESGRDRRFPSSFGLFNAKKACATIWPPRTIRETLVRTAL